VGTLTERGRIALEEGDEARAAAWLRRAVKQAPFDREALYNLSRCLQRTGPEAAARDCQARFERADADLKRLAELSKVVQGTPHDPAPRCEAGVLFLRNGQEAEGLRWLHLVLHEHPTYGPAHQALADYYERAGNTERAALHRRQVQASSSPAPVHP
jgi:Flp pilus assembly protein TadD